MKEMILLKNEPH